MLSYHTTAALADQHRAARHAQAHQWRLGRLARLARRRRTRGLESDPRGSALALAPAPVRSSAAEGHEFTSAA